MLQATHILNTVNTCTVSDIRGELAARQLPAGEYPAYVKNDFKKRPCYVPILEGVAAEYGIREEIAIDYQGKGMMTIIPLT